MQLIARLILAAVLAALAASSVAHAAGSAGMAAQIVAFDAAAMDVPNCDACADPAAGINGVACESVCGAGGFTAVLVQQCEAIALRPSDSWGSSVARDFRGLTGPPAKQPPRTLS